jgi:glycosyltransferase involved in cell wall biosynthesis
MRILKTIPHCFPAWAYGGTPRLVYEMSQGLVERGHSVSIITTDALDAEGRIHVDKTPVLVDGIQVFYLRNLSNWLAWNHNFSSSPSLVPVLRREIERCDIVHMHEFRTWENMVAYYFASRRKVPYVISTHGTLLRIVAKQHLKRAYDLLFGCRLLRGANRLIASSQGEADQYPVILAEVGLADSADRRIAVVANGIDPQDLAEMPPRDEFRHRYNIGDDEKVILFLGRLHAVKGLDLLVDAFLGLSDEDSSVRLVLAGPDEGEERRLRARSPQEVSERVLFPGLLTARDKLAALSSADVYAHPSESEALPLSVLEASASGIPVVVTGSCNVPEVAEYEAGFVVASDRLELQSAIQRILGNQVLQRTLGDNGRRMVLERFSCERVVVQLEALYREVIAERGRLESLPER